MTAQQLSMFELLEPSDPLAEALRRGTYEGYRLRAEAPSEEERAFTEEAVRNYEETLSERAMTRRQLRYKGGRYFR